MTKSLKSIYDDALKLVDDKNVFYRDILFLIEEIFSINQTDLIINRDKEYDDQVFQEKLNRLVSGEPVEYILGYSPFYGLKFNVNNNTLIPRNETEELIEKTIAYLNDNMINNPSIVDIGSGSGCIAITLNHFVKGSTVDSCDISKEALEVAKSNNIKNDTNVNFYLSDCLDEVIKLNKKYDVIISNPPYIDRETFVQESVLKYEPHLALFADNHGLAIYEKIFSQVDKVSKDKCLIALEISPDLVDGLTILRDKYLPNYKFKFEKDMNNLIRFMFLYK